MNDDHRTRKHTGLFIAAIALAAAGIGVTAVIAGSGRDTKQDEHLPVLFDAPQFSLGEINHLSINTDDLRGKIWVCDFIFTRCGGTCPEMSEMMQRLHDDLADVPDVRFLSISVDPKYDTPEALRTYAREYGADPERWFFAFGSEEEVGRIARDGFKVGSGDNIMNHSQKFILVDAEGRVRGYYDGSGPYRVAMTEELEKDIRALAERGGV